MTMVLIMLGWIVLGWLSSILWAIIRCLWSMSWPLWLLAALVTTLGWAARPAQAGWIDWLTGRAEARARAVELARHAEQNMRVAEVLRELSHERQSLVSVLETITQLSLRDSNWAAALTAAAPLLIVASTLLLATVAIWLVSRPVTVGGPTDSSDTLDVLIESFANDHATRVSLVGPTGNAPSAATVLLPSTPSDPGDSHVPHRRDQDPNQG